MPTTEADLILRVRTRIGLAATDGRLTDDDIERFLNDSIHYLALQSDWPWHKASQTINTVAGTSTYVPASAARVIRHLILPGKDQVIEEITHRTSAEYESLSQGIPRWFTYENGTIELYPTPNAAFALTLRYLKYPDVLDTALDEVDSPVMMDSLIVTKATMYAAEKLRDSEMAQRMDQTFRADLAEMKAGALDSRASIGINVRDDWLL